MTPILSAAGTFEASAVLTLMCLLSIPIGAALRRDVPRHLSLIGPVLVALGTSMGVLAYRIVVEVRLLSDENIWHQQAMMIADFLHGRQQSVGLLSAGKEGYAWIGGALYAVAGPAPLIPIVLGALLFILLVPTVGSITALVTSDLGFADETKASATLWSCYFTAACPVIVIWAPRMLRETISMFLIAAMVMFLLRYMARRRFGSLIWATSAAAVMLTVRAQVGIGVIAGLALSAVVARAARFRHIISRVLLVAPTFMLAFAITWSYVDSTAGLSADRIALRNRSLADASSAFEGSSEIYTANSIVDIVIFNLPRAAFGPFPHEVTAEASVLLAVATNVFWLICLAGTALFLMGRRTAYAGRDGGKSHAPTRSYIVLIVVGLTLVAILSITAGNYGLVARMRLMPFVVLIPAGVIGFHLWRGRRHQDELFAPAAVEARRFGR